MIPCVNILQTAIPVLRFQAFTLINFNTRLREETIANTASSYWEEENVRTLLSEISSLATSHMSKVRICTSLYLNTYSVSM